jgi:ABC-type multidrug transport system fused ATPase/permease subunit
MVLDHGKIMEIGSHDQLLAARGRYFQLHEKLSYNEESALTLNEPQRIF